MQSPPRDAISAADRRLLAHARTSHATHMRMPMQTAGHAATQHVTQHRSTAARTRPDSAIPAERGPYTLIASDGNACGGQGVPDREAGVVTPPPYPEPHRPPRYPCTFLDWTGLFLMRRFDSTSIDSIVLFVCLCILPRLQSALALLPLCCLRLPASRRLPSSRHARLLRLLRLLRLRPLLLPLRARVRGSLCRAWRRGSSRRRWSC